MDPSLTKNTGLPLIDLSNYHLASDSPDGRMRVIAEVCEASRRYGLFQVRGHGVPLNLQQDLLHGMERVFGLPEEEKIRMSFLGNPCRRGYEAPGMSHRDGDAMPDAKECFHVSHENPDIEFSGFFGPNVWPDLPVEEFRNPVYSYHQHTRQLGKMIWSILIEGLGHPLSLVDDFSKRPMVVTKLIRYPPRRTLPQGQFGCGAHTDFGGITVLIQQPGREGLEVWDDECEQWIGVPALEDVLVINCGDMVQRWSGGAFRSVKHRVINKTDDERLSCATFWHGDLNASNPFDPRDSARETVGQLLVKRFHKQYTLPKQLMEQVGAVR